MSDFLKNLSSYNLFNNLLPGVVFCVLATKTFPISLIQGDIVTGVFFYYFVGILISRFGSIIVEPLLKKIGFVSFSEYSDFISASGSDSKIEILSEVNNMYRTMLSMMLLMILTGGFFYLKANCVIFDQNSTYLVIFLLIIMFATSYRKQTQYIKERVTKVIDKGDD